MSVQVYPLRDQNKEERKDVFSMVQEEGLSREISTPPSPLPSQEHMVLIRDEKSPYFCETQKKLHP